MPTLAYSGGPSMYNPQFYPSKNAVKIVVSEKEAQERLSQYLNGRMNKILDNIPATKIRADLHVDVEKSFVPAKPLSWIVTQIESLDPDHHFELDTRDEYVKFVPNGETCQSMPVRSESLLSMPRPSTSERPKGNIPVQAVCDMVNARMIQAIKNKVSVERINNGLVEMGIVMERDYLLEFLRTHIETGDIYAILPPEKFSILQYNPEADDGVESVEAALKSKKLDEDDRKKEEEWREEKRRRDEEKMRLEEKRMEDTRRREEEENRKNEERERERETLNNVERAMRLKEDLRESFPHLRHLPYLIYLLQKVIHDMGVVVNIQDFERHLDDLVGGTFNYEIFGITMFCELIYHKLIVVVDRTLDNVQVRLNSLIEENNCRVEFMDEYLAGEMYYYIRRNGRATYADIYDYVDANDSNLLHEQFPKWKIWSIKERMEDVRAQHKSHFEVFRLEGEYLNLNPEFVGIVASPFLYHPDSI